MRQRTCNIIMCCKGNCCLEGGKDKPALEAIAAYMSKECGCPKEDYKNHLMESILRDALFDYIDGADRPSTDLRRIFESCYTKEPTMCERICTALSLVTICKVDKDESKYVNGFTKKLIAQSQIDLGQVPDPKRPKGE